MKASRKFLLAGLVVLSSLASSSLAWGDADASQNVTYTVVSFRYISLTEADGDDCSAAGGTPTPSDFTADGCAVQFQNVRRGDVKETMGGALHYATTLTNDLVTVTLDSDMDDSVVLGVYVSGAPGAGEPCVNPGTASNGANRTLSEGGVPGSVRAPLPLSSSTPKTLLFGISNCGATGAPATANLYYVLDAAQATKAGSGVDDQGTGNISAVKEVTYTLKAGA